LKDGVLSVIKIWGGRGKRTAGRKAKSGGFRLLGSGKRPVRTGTQKKANATTNQERIIDFETLLSWYNENKTPAAVGDELSQAFMYAMKQKKLKFL